MAEIPEPCFISDPYIPITPGPDDLTAAEIQQRAQEYDHDIHADPERFGRVLSALGDLATSSRPDDLDIEKVGLGVDDTEAARKTVAFFFDKIDNGLRFNAATDAALLQNKDYQVAREAHTNAKPVTLTFGVMTHVTTQNEKAIPARDTMRRLSIGLYIKEVRKWQAQEAAKRLQQRAS